MNDKAQTLRDARTVHVYVCAPVGSGKSAICGEIEILCKALGLNVEWPEGKAEKNMTGADWTHALEMYKPSVVIHEVDGMPALAQQPEAPPAFFVRDVAELIGSSVPDVCKALLQLGRTPRSTNMVITPDEALAVASHLAQQPAEGADWAAQMLADTKEVFDVVGSETPQAVRDVIEYVSSWIAVNKDKTKATPLAQAQEQDQATPPAEVNPWTENVAVNLAPSRVGRVYVAGPMTGIEDFNFPAFHKEAERLRASGLTVLNPADHGVVEGAEWGDYLRHDIAGLATCERIHLLPGWERSKGARLEVIIAKALGMSVTLAEGATEGQFFSSWEFSGIPVAEVEVLGPALRSPPADLTFDTLLKRIKASPFRDDMALASLIVSQAEEIKALRNASGTQPMSGDTP